MSESPHGAGGKHLWVQRVDPHPFLEGGFRLPLAPAVMIFSDRFLGVDHTDGLGALLGKRKVGLAPKLHLASLARVLFCETIFGLSGREQYEGILVEVAVFLFQREDQTPTHFLGQIQDRGLGVEGIQQQDVEEAATVRGPVGVPADGARLCLRLLRAPPTPGRERL